MASIASDVFAAVTNRGMAPESAAVSTAFGGRAPFVETMHGISSSVKRSRRASASSPAKVPR